MTRQFMWCRQEIARDCTGTVDHFHIAIATPEGTDITPSCGKKTLNLKFYDLVPAQIEKSEAFKTKPEKGLELIAGCFKEHHAQKIADFVKEGGEKAVVVVNCEAGVSRSPAVVMALRKFYGGDHDECFREAYPNVHVASVLGTVLGIGTFEAPKYNRVQMALTRRTIQRLF